MSRCKGSSDRTAFLEAAVEIVMTCRVMDLQDPKKVAEEDPKIASMMPQGHSPSVTNGS